MNLARFISQQSRAVVVLILLLSVAGLYAAWQLPTAIFPQTDFPRVVIIVDNGVVPAPQMLASVTRPLEEAMNGIPGIVRIKSTTSRGAAEINLFFDWSVDVLQSLQLVQARLSQLSSTLPPTAEIRNVDRLTFAVFPVAGYSLVSDTRDPASLRDIGNYTIKPRLARLAGVADVSVAGGKNREYHVTIDPDRLSAHGVSVQQVADAVRNSNVIASPGLIEENHRLELTLVSGQATSPEQLNSIVVAVVNNAPIVVADVATVGSGVEPEYTIVTADGHPAVLLNIRRQPDANTVTVDDEVKTELAAIAPLLPKDVKVAPFYDQSLLVRESIKSVRDSILIGLLLSVAILYAFLRNWGTTFVATLVIPVTVLATFLAMYLVGLSFDLMTLGGVAAAIGLVIDDAIVVVENIYTHLARGQSRRQAVEAAISEITVPIIGSTLTPVVVFLPLTLLTGVTGVFFRSLALTMAVALLTSLVLALSFTPVLAERFVKVRRRDQKTPVEDEPATAGENRFGEMRTGDREEEEEGGRFLRAIIRRYEWVLAHALSSRWLVIVVCLVVLAGSYLLFRNLGSDFLPAFDEGAFILDYKAPPGTSLAETDRILLHVEAMLKETPEVESYSRRTGLQLGLFITEPNTGDFLVKLKPGHQRPTADVTDDLRGQIESSEPALEFEFVGILTDLIGDLTSSPAPIEIKLFSEDTAALDRTAALVEESIKKVPGVVDTFDGVVVSGPAITFKIDPQLAARFGVTATDVANTVTTAMTGDAASAILQQGRLITVRVLLPQAARQSLDTLKALLVRSASGAQFRLDQVAQIEYDKGQTEIQRDGLRQSVAVTAHLSGSDLGSAISAIKTQLGKDVKLPAGMTLEYGGLYQEQQSSFRELLMALLLAIVLVFITLLIEFRSFAHPISIVTGAVLALGGVLAGLFVTGSTLNIVSLMGMIMVVGIVAKNGILMLDAVEDHLAAGDTLREALLRSGRRRFRPVLMTSLAAILGMLPLALAIGSGAELLQPLAIAVIGGLTVALLLSLVVTPTVYAMLSRQKRDHIQTDRGEDNERE
ncbi:MAG TPA: efflux RND transporter permease subunit [Pyrinomonadaceae bacterium]|jgi:hydrophobe/amphiphile efflux-1 (HAE1) family protein|nr:efflux RND transporter permease subunit [Pyrinomonadaceae bacterium]